MNILDKCSLTDDEADLAAKIIDLFGDGEHPAPTEQSIHFFTPSYTIECLDEAIRIGSPSKYMDQIVALKAKLEEHQAAWVA